MNRRGEVMKGGSCTAVYVLTVRSALLFPQDQDFGHFSDTLLIEC